MTTKSLKASSGRPLPVHVSQHGRIPWHTLHPKPRSRVMSDLCLLWTPCALVLVSWCIYTAVLTHTACSLQDPTPYPSGLHPSPHPLLVRQKEFLSWFLFIFFLYLTGVPRHRPSFLHGGLVSNYSLASGDLLRCVAGVRKDLFCLCHSRRNLALICSSGPPPNPVPSLVVGRELSAAVWSLPPSSQSPSPSPSSEAF